MISTVTGEPVRGPEINVDYWWRNVREPVRFTVGIARLLRDGCTVLVEIGPHPVMAAALAEIALAQKSPALSVASLRRTEDERGTMLHGLAALYRNGAPVRWEAIYARPARAIRLPAYPWQRQRLWHEFTGAARELRSAPAHPLLGDRQPLPQPTWLNYLDVRLIPWLGDHRIAGSPVMPAAAYLEMAAAAVREFLGESTLFLEDIKFHHLLFLPDERPVPTCVRLDPAGASFQIFAARPDAPTQWEIQAEGLYRPGRLHLPPPADLDLIREECKDERDPRTLYREPSDMGQVYGPAFQGLTSLRTRGDEAVLGVVAPPVERVWAADYILFPPALDSCFHSGTALRRREDSGAFIIMSLRQVRVFRPLPEKLWSHLQLVERSENSYVGHLTVYDPTGAVVAQAEGVTVRRARPIDVDSKQGESERKFYHFTWETMALSAV